LAVDTDLRVSLDSVAELCVESVDACIDVVLKELAKGRPEPSGIGCVTEDEVEDHC
jgi:hypothetical protein